MSDRATSWVATSLVRLDEGDILHCYEGNTKSWWDFYFSFYGNSLIYLIRVNHISLGEDFEFEKKKNMVSMGQLQIIKSMIFISHELLCVYCITEWLIRHLHTV